MPPANCPGGVRWLCGCPDEKYDVNVLDTHGNDLTPGWMRLDERDDPKLEAMLCWLFKYKVHNVLGCDVVFNEELVFVVNSVTITEEPWRCDIQCWSVWDQMECTIQFRVATN